MARLYSKKSKESKAQAERQKGQDCTALYIRVSTDKQAEEGFSLDAQEEKLYAYCVAQGWTVCEGHVYVDAGMSGKTADRPEYLRMLEAAQVGEIRRIVAMKLDRLARNVMDFLRLVEGLKAMGTDLVLVKEQFDTSTPHGKFALTMFAAMAELEAATITERVMSGKAQKAREGGYNGGPPPYGYRYDGEAFHVDTGAAKVIRDVLEEFDAGATLRSIANRLNEEGIPTGRGGRWHAATVRYMLDNGFYAGLAQWHGEETDGEHPAIISKEQYRSIHQRLLSLRRGNPTFRQGRLTCTT